MNYLIYNLLQYQTFSHRTNRYKYMFYQTMTFHSKLACRKQHVSLLAKNVI